MRWQPLLTYPVSDQRVPDLFAALEQDHTSTRVEVQRVAQLLAGPDGTAELYLALRSDGADHDTAWQAAHVTYADPDPLVP